MFGHRGVRSGHLRATWIAFWTGLTLWVFSLFVLRLMAKADPQMRFVYLRHIRYAAYYPARSTPFRENTRDYK
ncbi:MAG: conjugal transfer protein TrbD [Bilophila wadsworthia]